MKKNKILILLLTILIIGFTGCTQQVTYPKYHGKNVAILYGDLPNIIEAQFGRLFTTIQIDNLTSKPFYLKPGKYIIKMSAGASSPFAPLSAEKTTTFDFKGNKIYQIRSESFIIQNLVVFSIFDITGEKEKLVKTIYAKGYL